MPQPTAFFPESKSRDASVNALMTIKPKAPELPITIIGRKLVLRGVSFINNVRDLQPAYSIQPKPEIVNQLKSESYFRTV